MTITSIVNVYPTNLLRRTLVFLSLQIFNGPVIFNMLYLRPTRCWVCYGDTFVLSLLLLYLSLVRPHLLYCSPLWHPHLIVHIKSLESVQRRATKFILSDSTASYRDRLIKLRLLPLMMEFELCDILFLINSLKKPTRHFDVFKYIHISNHSTRSSHHFKLIHSISKNNTSGNFYFNRIPRLWNSIPPLDISLSAPVLKAIIRDFFWDRFISNFSPDNVCSYHLVCPCRNCSKLPICVKF